MRKISLFVVLAVAVLFGIMSNAFAWEYTPFPSPPYPVPYTLNGETYDYIIQQHSSQNYNADYVTYAKLSQLETNYFYFYRQTNALMWGKVGLTGAANGVTYRSQNGGSTWTKLSSVQMYTPYYQEHKDNLIRSNVDIKWSGASGEWLNPPYTCTTFPLFCDFSPYWDGKVEISASSFGGGPAIFKFPLSGTLGDRTILLEFGDTWVSGECPTGVYKKHAGIDLNASTDEEVYAAHDGTIKAIFTGNHAQWADAIIIEDDDQRYTTVYWHIIKYDDLAVDDHVTKGQQIATVADLGGNTHFHFGFRSSSYDSSFSLVGALPEEDCGSSPTYPAFPENFIDPARLTYE